jgi:hypothetical protein
MPFEDYYKVYLQDKNEHFISEFNKGDFAFIYEAKGPSEVEEVEQRKKRRLKLQQGRKGIIALVRIVSDFMRGNEYDYNPLDGSNRKITYIGYFDTEKVACRRGFVPLEELREAYLEESLPRFYPLINGGLRKLKPEQCKIMTRLIGFTASTDPVHASLGILKDKGFTFEDFLKERQRERKEEIKKENKDI